ncbi:helix-turn-helix domain-containing protein [Pseudomonas sp. Fl4BN2]|nr:helix-turn-helix domain-containing protein [Pseudomonas sp. Fl4BN2]
MATAGLNQAALAERLNVSRETISKWLKADSFPKPDKLLRLASLLKLSFSELVQKVDPNEPIVAFRKARGTKTTEAHYARAKSMGNMLKHLTPYLPFDKLAVPPTLKNPVNDYDYLQEIAKRIRLEVGVGACDKLDFSHLIKYFKQLQAVIVPVLWGSKERHENATHIFLPESTTTWIYLNLDVNVLDFKFWMAHELGHCLSPGLRGDVGEDFADAFAGALLFPHEQAKKSYDAISLFQEKGRQINKIKEIALETLISPYSIYCQCNAYAQKNGLNALHLEPTIFQASANVNREIPLLSYHVFGGEQPAPPDYIKKSKQNFDTPFFDVMGQYLKDTGKGPGFVQTIMDVSALDARGISAELI